MTDTPENQDDFQQSPPPEWLERMAAEVLQESGGDDDSAPGAAITSMAAQVLMHEKYRGVFPHPSYLREFDDVVTNGAERAFALTEQEQRHRHECDRLVLSSQVDSQAKFDADRRLLIILSFIAVAILVVGALVLALLGKTLGAGIFAGLSILGAGGVLLVRRARESAKE